MSLFHRHSFVERYRVFAPPPLKELAGLNCSEHMGERLLFGVTTIVARCAECGQAETTEVLGNAAQPKQVTP